jgi:hypothetical protein
LLALEHFYVAFWIDLVVGLFPLSEDTDGIIGFTSTARAGTVALGGGLDSGRESGHAGAQRTFDFFRRHRSQALHTLFRIPPSRGDDGSRGGVMIEAPIACWGVQYQEEGGNPDEINQDGGESDRDT